MKTKPNSKKIIKQRGRAQTRHIHDKRHCGGALFTVLKKAAEIGYKLGKDEVQEYGCKGNHWQLKQHLGKYDLIMQTMPFLLGYSQKGQSKQGTGDVRTCQCRSINAVSKMALNLF